MDIAFTGGTELQRSLVREAVGALRSRHFTLDAFDHTWNVQFLPVGVIDTTPHDAFKTFMVTQNDGTTQIRNDMPFASGPFGGTQFFQESVVHELGHHLLGNGPDEGFIDSGGQAAIAAMFDSTPSTWNPQNKVWDDRPVEGIAETFKDSFMPASRRVYFNRTREKLAIEKYPEFRSLWRAGVFTVDPNVAVNTDVFAPLKVGSEPTFVYAESGLLLSATLAADHHLRYQFTPPVANWPAGWWDYTVPSDNNSALYQGGSLQWEFALIVNAVTVIAHGGIWELWAGPDDPGAFAMGWSVPEVGAAETGPGAAYHTAPAPGGHLWRMGGSLSYAFPPPPDLVITDVMDVQAGDIVTFKAGVSVVGPVNFDAGPIEYPGGEIIATPYLPTMIMGEQRDPMEVPDPSLQPGGLDSGVIKHARVIG